MQALPIRCKLGDYEGIAQTQINLGVVAWSLGKMKEALDFYARGLRIAREHRFPNIEATALSDTGLAYDDLGQELKALDDYGQALAIEGQVGDRRNKAITLQKIGAVYCSLKQTRKGLDYYGCALAIEQELGDRLDLASTLASIGLAHHDLGDYQKALGYYLQSLPIRRAVGDLVGEAVTLHNIGANYGTLGQWQTALDYYAEALPIERAVGRRQYEAWTFKLMGLSLRALGAGRLANVCFKRSVDAWQSLRADVLGMSPGDRRTYAEQSASTYLEISNCLASDNRAAEAEQFLAQSKIDSLAPLLPVEYTSTELGWRNGMDSRIARLVELAHRVSQLRPLRASALSPAQSNKLRTLEADQDSAKIEFRRYLTRAMDESTVASFRDALQHPHVDPRMIGKQLYEVLIKPIETMLDPNAVTAWCLAGSLRTMPIGALYDGKSYLFEKYPSVTFSPAFVPILAKTPSYRPSAIVAGVTTTSSLPDPINGVAVSFPKLASVREETNATARALGTKPMLDRDFTTKGLLASLAKHPGVVHLASHFRYVPGDDRRSFLLTGGNGAWTVESIKSLPDDALKGVDLVTLSACATGEGESPTGEEVESFAGWMQRKGASAVLSTLWPIADPSTALLMGEFYRLRRAHPEWTKIEDLRQAQLGMLHGRLYGKGYEQTRSELGKKAGSKLNAPLWPTNLPKYSHPYYWAAFVLTGNWQ
jgi:CHAT domain-containing protein